MMQSVKQLCAPLSAKVMPRCALVDNAGEAISYGMALSIQRKAGIDSRIIKKTNTRPECKTPDCKTTVSHLTRSGMCEKCMHNEFCMCARCRLKRGEMHGRP